MSENEIEYCEICGCVLTDDNNCVVDDIDYCEGICLECAKEDRLLSEWWWDHGL